MSFVNRVQIAPSHEARTAEPFQDARQDLTASTSHNRSLQNELIANSSALRVLRC
jgi:hypothetical protein